MILINKNLPENIISFLEEFDTLYMLPDLKQIKGSTARHTDLACCFLNGEIVAAPEIYEFFKENGVTFPVTEGKNTPKSGYPSDILYNAAPVGRFLFCSEKNTDPVLLKKASEAKMTVIDVKQGYAKCSIVKADEGAIITADRKIHKKALENGLDSLLISPGNVFLGGYDTGFIGGCSVKTDKYLIFTGNIETHPDFDKISEFCNRRGVPLFYDRTFPLTDVGSPIFIPNI